MLGQFDKKVNGSCATSSTGTAKYYKRLLILFYRRGRGEDFIERTLALYIHIIRNPAGFASGLVPLIKVA